METKVSKKRRPPWRYPFFTAPPPLLTSLFVFEYSNKDEERLKTYKNVYSKLLRAEKNAPLLRRVELHIELLQQLTPQAGSDDTHS